MDNNKYVNAYKQNGYELKQKIGSGGFAVVYLAQSIKYDIPVAIKSIEIDVRKRKQIQYLNNELEALEKLKHEHVVQLYEHFLLDNAIHIVMEYCRKGNLGNVLRKNKQGFDEEYTRALFIQMSKAIHYVHSCGIAHRDLKLNNILLVNNYTCKVADFGLAVVCFDEDNGVIYSKSYCGTKPYMAPEILQKRFTKNLEHDPMKSDVWAMGVILFTLLVGQYPFDMQLIDVEGLQKWKDLVNRQRERKWRWTKSAKNRISQDARDLLQHLMDANILRRITMVGVLAHPWIVKPLGPRPSLPGPSSPPISRKSQLVQTSPSDTVSANMSESDLNKTMTSPQTPPSSS